MLMISGHLGVPRLVSALLCSWAQISIFLTLSGGASISPVPEGSTDTNLTSQCNPDESQNQRDYSLDLYRKKRGSRSMCQNNQIHLEPGGFEPPTSQNITGSECSIRFQSLRIHPSLSKNDNRSPTKLSSHFKANRTNKKRTKITTTGGKKQKTLGCPSMSEKTTKKIPKGFTWSLFKKVSQRKNPS